MPDKTDSEAGHKYCYRCFRPVRNCLCQEARPFFTQTEFIFLLHSKEARKEKTGTGRLAQLCLQNSRLFSGTDFSEDHSVNQLLSDPEYYSVLLFPGENSVDINTTRSLQPAEKKLRVFVPDGTWTLIKRMIKKNTALSRLPQICFTPPRPSQFVLKKEPNKDFVCTIEAVYYFLEAAQIQGWEDCKGKHKVLLEVLTKMVEYQLDRARENRSSGRSYS